MASDRDGELQAEGLDEEDLDTLSDEELDEELDEEEVEELDDDEVEAGLDVILKERLVVEEDAEEDEEEPVDADDRSDGASGVLPKQPGEFVCQSCFLVKSVTQLADTTRVLCRDCV